MQYGPGVGEDGVTEVRFRCALRPMARRERTKTVSGLVALSWNRDGWDIHIV
jgi:hypothetical protein